MMPSVADYAAERRWWVRFWDKPPGGLLLGLTVVVCLLVLWAASYPTINIWFILATYPALAIGLAWFIKCLVFVVRTKKWQHGKNYLAPAAVLIACLLLVANAPLQLRWQLSQDAFNDAVSSIAAGKNLAEFDGVRLGAYEVQAVQTRGSNLYFVIADSGFIDIDGLAYFPDGRAEADQTDNRGDWFRHLEGNWYRFSLHW
ncbi:MAG: hypothetical protein ACRCSF_08585 [Mycobacteriaceae bacterium]